MESPIPQGSDALGPARGRPSRLSLAADGRFLLMLALSLVLVALVVTGKLAEPEPARAGGARRADAQRIERLIREGALSGREALFFHEVDPSGRSRAAPAETAAGR